MPASCAATEMTKTGVSSSTRRSTPMRGASGRPPLRGSAAAITGSRGIAPGAGEQLRPRVLARGGPGERLQGLPRGAVHPLRRLDLEGDEQVAGALRRPDAVPLDPQ